MGLKGKIYLLFILFLLIPRAGIGQIEESAEVFLEAYTDEFQEHFFEGLKQRGIENYDRAIKAFLMCKNLDPSNPVVDHELAKSYVLDKKLILAMDHAREAVLQEPDNRWYLDTFISITIKQGYDLEQIKTMTPYQNVALKTNLAHILYTGKGYKDALNVLAGIPENNYVNQLRSKALDSLSKNEETVVAIQNKEVAVADNPLDTLRERFKTLLEEESYLELERESLMATEQYPTQPDFYYYHGIALRNLKEFARAVRSLEAALDYLLDDREMANNIYRQLAGTYNDMGNSSKANTYLSKIKTGL